MEVERAHRVYRSQNDSRNSPRSNSNFIFKLLRYQDRQRLLKASRASGPISQSGANLRFFIDYSSFTSKRRMAFLPLQKSLRAEGIESFLLYPAQLKVTISGGEMCGGTRSFRPSFSTLSLKPHGFWRSGSNVFSAALLLLSLVAVFAEGATSFFSTQNFRPIRALRILKIISFSPTLQALVVMLAKAMKRALYMMCIVFFIMFIFAVAGVLYFGEKATGDVGHWGNLWSALLTVFGLTTLDSWVDLLKKVDNLGVAYSRLFPIIFILVGHFVFFNMFMGLVIMEVERMMKDREEVLREQQAAQKRRKQKRTMKQLIGSQEDSVSQQPWKLLEKLPPLGFQTPPSLEFLHCEVDERRPLLEGDTCTVCIRLPVHPAYEEFE
ncbi:hypothetical protein SRHO_G00203750 [Serrasalmus rhombeus]